ncbi:XRE family transcriptional regulator [bacterium]|nr:XRE family transcriptional regulator [bacterium]
MKEISNRQKNKLKKKIAADRLREARINAGYPSANHASISLGWSVKVYLQHEQGIKSFNIDDAKKYSKAFKVSSEYLHPYEDDSNG